MSDIQVSVRKNGTLFRDGECSACHHIVVSCSGLELYYASSRNNYQQDTAKLLRELSVISHDLGQCDLSHWDKMQVKTIISKDRSMEPELRLSYPLYRPNISWNVADCILKPKVNNNNYELDVYPWYHICGKCICKLYSKRQTDSCPHCYWIVHSRVKSNRTWLPPDEDFATGKVVDGGRCPPPVY